MSYDYINHYIGFTGTRKGMSPNQFEEVSFWLEKYYKENGRTRIIHGACMGADMEFHALCKNRFNRWAYPGVSKDYKGNMILMGEYDYLQKPKYYLDRNRDIVNDTHVLLACPLDNIQKGGTWYTINYAKKIGKQVIIFER